MKGRIDTLLKQIGAVTSFLTVEEIYKRFMSEKEFKELKKRVEALEETNKNLSEQANASQNPKVSEKFSEVSDSVTKVVESSQSLNETQTILENASSEPVKKSLEIVLKTKTQKTIESCEEAVSKMESFIKYITGSDGKSSSFIDSNSITNFIDSLRNILSSLETSQLLALVHISTSVFIIGCFISILVVIYSEILIKKFNFEKYPRIAKLIELRSKFQHYYLLVNTIMIFIAFLLTIFIDYVIFMNPGL